MNTNVSDIQILLFLSIIFLSHVITNLHIISVNGRLLMEVLILICISFVYKFIVVSRTMKLYSQNEMKGKTRNFKLSSPRSIQLTTTWKNQISFNSSHAIRRWVFREIIIFKDANCSERSPRAKHVHGLKRQASRSCILTYPRPE